MKRRLHLRCRLAGRLDRLLDRSEAVDRRFILVGCHHLGELIHLPEIEDRCRQRVDDAGGADDDRPGKRHDAEKVVEVEPFDARAAVPAHRAEIEFAHEGCIEDHARDDGRDEEKPHEAEKEQAGKACEHVGVEPEHEIHEAFVEGRCVEDFARPGVEGEKAAILRWRVRGGRCRHIDERLMVVETQILHDIAPMPCEAGRDDAVEVRHGRIGGHLPGLRVSARKMIDLFIEDERQARDAEHQQEGRRDEARPFVARPFVNEIPVLDRPRRHDVSGLE